MTEYIELPNIATPVTRIALGGCPLGGHGWGKVEDKESIRTVRKALDLGINFYDTADIYGLGHSEEILNVALGAERRKVIIATKFGVRRNSSGKTFYDVRPAWARQALESSLRRLGVEAIPLYYMHWPDGITPIEDVVGFLGELRQEGKILGIGLSNVTAEQVERAALTATISAVQVQYSLVDRRAAENLLKVTIPNRIPLVTWGSLGQGVLSGKYDATSIFAFDDRRSRYENFKEPKLTHNLCVVAELSRLATQVQATPAQLAIRWLLAQDGVGVSLFGAKTIEQVSDNVQAMKARLTKEQLSRLTEVALQNNCLAGHADIKGPSDLRCKT